jgi:hypothetical protein
MSTVSVWASEDSNTNILRLYSVTEFKLNLCSILIVCQSGWWPDDGGSKHPCNVGQFLPDYAAQHTRRGSSSYSPPWEPEISLRICYSKLHFFFFPFNNWVSWPVPRLKELSPSPSWTPNVTSSNRMIRVCLPRQAFTRHPLYMIMPFLLVFFYFFRHSFCVQLFSYLFTSYYNLVKHPTRSYTTSLKSIALPLLFYPTWYIHYYIPWIHRLVRWQ